MFPKLFAGLLTKLEKMNTATKLGLIALMSIVALWLICKKMAATGGVPLGLPPHVTTAFVPGNGLQDPGYGSGVGSVSPLQEGFIPEAACLGMDEFGKRYPSPPFYQMACQPEPRWNLPLDNRLRHRPIYGAPAELMPECQHRHPMGSIYAPPNEGIKMD